MAALHITMIGGVDDQRVIIQPVLLQTVYQLAAAMMLRYSFDMAEEADCIEKAVAAYLDAGYRTADIMGEGMKQVGCAECGRLITENLRKG